jgi:FHA domain/Domain of unknown function (DUF1707)
MGSPPLRASDADRAGTVDALREEFVMGRLSHQTFMYRMQTAMEARHVADLPPLLADLPPAPPPRPGLLGRLKGTFRRRAGRSAEGRPSGDVLANGPAAPSHPGPGQQSPARRLTSAMHLPVAAPSIGGAGKHSKVPPVPLPFPRASEGFFTIGRDARNDLAIDDMTVSRIHARLERTPAGWVLKDLSSTNGTRVNGWRVRGQVTVHAGDVVRFGDIEYTLTEDTGRGDRGDQTHVSTH